MNKQAQGFQRPVSFILALAFLILGLVPILNQFNVIDFQLPGVPYTVLWVLSIIGGLILLLDAMKAGQIEGGSITMISYVAAVVVLVIGLIPLLNLLGVVSWQIPVFVDQIINYLYVLVGLLLAWGGMKAGY